MEMVGSIESVWVCDDGLRLKDFGHHQNTARGRPALHPVPPPFLSPFAVPHPSRPCGFPPLSPLSSHKTPPHTHTQTHVKLHTYRVPILPRLVCATCKAPASSTGALLIQVQAVELTFGRAALLRLRILLAIMSVIPP